MNDQQKIQTILKKLGFVLVGFLHRKEARFGNWIEGWLEKGYQGEMLWLGNHESIRADPCSIESYGKSLITMAFPYYTEWPETWGEKNPVSNYAWGEDYHKVLKKKIEGSLSRIGKNFP